MAQDKVGRSWDLVRRSQELVTKSGDRARRLQDTDLMTEIRVGRF